MQSNNKSSKRRKGDRKGKSQEKHQDRSNHKNQNGSVNKQYDFGVLKSLFQGFSNTAAAKFTSGLGGNSESDEKQAGTTTPGNFDIYLFAQSWAPRFCCTNTKKCKKEGMDNTDDLSPHGSYLCCFKNDCTCITFYFQVSGQHLLNPINREELTQPIAKALRTKGVGQNMSGK
jgi:hypothetical protein